MHLEQRKDGWWIVEVPEAEDCGPYERKADAVLDRRGLVQFYRLYDDLTFFEGEEEIGRGIQK